MQFLSVRDLRSKSREVWKRLSNEKEIVITSKGRPIAIMSAVEGRDLEQSLLILRRARASSAVESMQLSSVKSGKDRMTLAEISAEIKKVRGELPH